MSGPSQKLIPFKGADLTNDELYIGENSSPFLKNVLFDLNRNPGNAHGGNLGVFTPVEGNEIYGTTAFFPAGVNTCIGTYHFKKLNHLYAFVHNSNNNHFIYRVNGNLGVCEKVSISSCWNFQLVPKHFISETRCTIQTVERFNKVTNKVEEVLYMVCTDNYNNPWFLCIEDAIATDSFNATLFPYFNSTDSVKCDWFKLGVPTPQDCITVTPVKRDITDAVEVARTNNLYRKAFQFRVKFFNVWEQDSEHGVISTQYIGVTGSSCIEISSGMPRCVRLRFKAGSPLIDKIQIEFRTCNAAIRGYAVNSDWFLYEVLEKYECANVNWWERAIENPWGKEYTKQIGLGKTIQEATDIAYSKGLTRYYSSDNTFEYTFCNNKECQAIPVRETNRRDNPLALTAGSVVPLNKSVALSRLVRDFEPLTCEALDKFKLTVTPPAPGDASCKSVLRKVIIYGLIYNPYEDQPIPIRNENGRNIFGYADCSKNNPFAYQQILPVDQEGIIGYMAGTGFYSISKQHSYDLITGNASYTGVPYETTGNVSPASSPVQKWEFDLPPGKYVFRIAGHRSSPKDPYEKTSTYFAGTTSLNNPGNIISDYKEILIDACTSDVTINANVPVIYDLTRKGRGCLVVDATSVVAGYVYEDEVEKRPIELAKVETTRSAQVNSGFTDHNGFFFASSTKNHLGAIIRGNKDCGNTIIASTDETHDGFNAAGAFFGLVGLLVTAPFDGHFVENIRYVYKGTDKYLVKDQVKIKGTMVLCDNSSIGVAGALVVLRRGGYAFTDINGDFTLVGHDHIGQSARVEEVVYSQRGVCILYACGTGCNPCFINPSVTFPACNGSARTLFVSTLGVKIKGLNQRGPQEGGRYGYGLVMHDWLGRQSYVQSGEQNYIDIPSVHETQTFDFSSIGFTIDANMVFPTWVKEISFYLTENLNFDNYLMWVAERLQFVDNTGNVNTASPSQIRMYYEGLGEYNKQYNFSTNSVWQFLKEDAAVVGDYIEIIANGDGTIFPNKTIGQVRYDKEGRYIAIDYNDDLRDLKDGALIKLVRPKQCENKQFFYEVCPVIKVNQTTHKAEVLSGTLPFWDAYYVTRQIPVPLKMEKKTKDEDGNEIITSSSINELHSYPFLFQHHSPSDFWGDHCYTKGRINIRNAYEKQNFLKSATQESAALANGGVLNGLHYFDDNNLIIFNEQEWGGITGVIAGVGFLLYICEQNNFMVGYNDNAIRARADGSIVANSAEGKFGQPERKIGSEYGCQLDDINTIRKHQGHVMFLDRSRSAIIAHDYSSCKEVSAPLQQWVWDQIRRVQKNIGTYFHAVVDPSNDDYMLTVCSITSSNTSSTFIDNKDHSSAQTNETVVISIPDFVFKGWRSFVPEYFGILEADERSKQLISFVRGSAYRHYRTARPFVNFYGIQCKPYIAGVANIENTKSKNFMYMEVYCSEVLFEAVKVVTKSGQLSRIMQKWWDKRNKFYAAPFLCDLNTKADINRPEATGANRLLDGDSLYGEWLSFLLTPRLEDAGKYFEYTAAIVYFYGSEKSSNT